MATAGISSLANGITEQLEAMVKRANLVPAYLNRVVYREYQNAQRLRWQNENNGDDFTGGQWASLDPAYAEYKKRKYKGYPGNGSKKLIATGRLQKGVIGPSSDHQKAVTNRSIRISHSVEYGRYVDAKRTFTGFSDKFYSRLYKGIADYLVKNVVRGGG